MKAVDLEPADRKMCREIDFGRRGAFEAEAMRAGPAHAEVEFEVEPIRGQQRSDERIRSARRNQRVTSIDSSTEAGRQAAARYFNTSAKCDRRSFDDTATGERDQLKGAGRRRNRETHHCFSVEAVDHAAGTEQPCLERHRMARPELERDPGIERNGGVEVELQHRSQRKAHLRYAMHEGADGNTAVASTCRRGAQREERNSGIDPARFVAAQDARDQLGRRIRISLRHETASELFLHTPRQLPQTHWLAECLDQSTQVRHEAFAIEVGGAPAVSRLE